jgi:hypothetical protein
MTIRRDRRQILFDAGIFVVMEGYVLVGYWRRERRSRRHVIA